MAKEQAQQGAEAPTKKKKAFKKRGEKRIVHHGFVHVQASFNNTLITITDADRRVWFDTARELHQLQEKANAVAEMVQNAFAQVQTLQEQTKNANLSGNAKQQLDNVVKEFEAVRRRLGLGQQGGGFGGNTENLRGRFGQIKGQVMASTAVPTNTQMMQVREIKAALPGLIDQANAVVAKVPGLVKDLIGNGAIFPAIKPVPKG